MNRELKTEVEEYVNHHTAEAEELLMELGKIPAPSRMEDKRAVFCLNWLTAQGARDVTIDSAKNVVCKIGLEEHDEIAAFMAHTDIVFPDTAPLVMCLEGRRLYAPGIGDDTANLVNLLMAAKYIIQNAPELAMGFLIVANACEEGLGNLDGCKEIMNIYGDRIKAFYSFDGYLSQCTSSAVGSHRYRITVKTAGGHSWVNFGEPNAIEVLCGLVEKLYRIQVPAGAKTTYNVGCMSGGTTVNTIPQEASMLFEFRSTSQRCLEIMQNELGDIIKNHTGAFEISTELLGIRPGNGEISREQLDSFTGKSADVIREFYTGELDYDAYSTDSNIPLSRGIPANTIGTVSGAKAHTREEWVDLDSLPAGMKIVLSLMLQYVKQG